MRTALLLCAMSLALGFARASVAEPFANGVVYHDRNRNGSQDRFEFGVRGVAVSNGSDVVTTDWRGRYRLPVGDDTFIFVVKPGGWQTAVDSDQLPRFYYHHRPAGSPDGLDFPGIEPTGPLPERVDFALHRSKEPDRFSAIVLGDPQPYTLEQLGWLEHDAIEELIGSDALFGMSLGDLVGDDLSLFEPLNRAVAQIGIPWHNVLGNHDINFRASGDEDSDDSFERVYGPPSYAFEYGRVHFMILDDVFYNGVDTESGRSGGYRGYLAPRVLEFITNYLETVPKDRLIVLAMHIPFDSPPHEVENRSALFEILRDRPHTLSLAGHTHFQENQFFGNERGFDGDSPHHQLIAATSSGSWWLGATDEVGIPLAPMRCGSPKGYSILDFDGDRYTVRFKASRRPSTYQMNIYAPDSVASADAADTEIVANVFGGSERSRVEFRLGDSEGSENPWIPMSKELRPDPAYVAAVGRDLQRDPRPPFFLPPPMQSPHLWVGKLPTGPSTGTHSIVVRSVDMYGQTFVARRLIRID